MVTPSKDTTLFNDTLFYNVAYGSRGKVTLSEVNGMDPYYLHFVHDNRDLG